MCLVTLPRWDSPNTLVRSCQISSELTYQLDVQLKLGFLVILYLLGRLVVGNSCYFHVASLIKPAELGQNIRPSQGIPIHSFPCGKTADLRLRQEKEMQRSALRTFGQSFWLYGEEVDQPEAESCLQLRGLLGSFM